MQRRHTRDGTRRRSYNAGGSFTTSEGGAGAPSDGRGQPASPGNVGRSPNHYPRSDDNVSAENTAAEGFYTDANNAAANSNVAAWASAVKSAARAAANARSGANSTGTDADDADAAEAESWAARATKFSLYTCSVAECRTRGGTATLVGYSEFTGYASTPPKKYRRKTLAHNNWFRCAYTGTCTTATGADTVRRTGYCQYSPTTGALDSTNSLEEVMSNPSGGCGHPVTVVSSSQACAGEFGAIAGAGVVNTATTNTRSSDGTCNSNSRFFGSQAQTLSDEDAEADAIARLLAASAWSGWTAAGSSSCLAGHEERTAGFNVGYTEAEFRATISIPSGTSGTVKVGVYRRAYGSGLYALYSTSTFAVTGDGSNEDHIAMTVPNDRGYQTYVACLPAGT